jgi:hypothetical protein
MDDLLREAAAILAALAAGGHDAALVGGLAVRAWVGEESRRTLDIDFCTRGEGGVAAAARILAERGYRGDVRPPWSRFVRSNPRRVVDVTDERVVDLRSFDSYRVDLGAARPRPTAPGLELRCVSLEDLVITKLLSGRDQDLVDLVLLAARTTPPPDDVAIKLRAEGEDIEIALAAAVMRAKAALASGGVQQAYATLTAKPLSPDDAQGFLALLTRLLP